MAKVLPAFDPRCIAQTAVLGSEPSARWLRVQSAVVSFARAPELASIVRPAVLWWDDARVIEHDPRLDQLLAEAERTVRANPPTESLAVRAMYKRVGLDPTCT